MIAALLKGIVLGLMLSISVGPIIFSIIKQSINNGHKAGYVFVAGVSASDITFVLICNFFTSLFESLLSHKTIIAIAGSIFLFCLGIYTFFFKKVAAERPVDAPLKVFSKRQMLAIFMSGYLMNTLNPGAFLFWFVWTTAIVGDSLNTPHPIQYRIIVFATCLCVVLFSDISKVFFAGKLRSNLTPKNMHLIDQLSGIILIGFAVVLFWTGIKEIL